MIIQCDQCQTKFKLDDAKVAEKSIKVRCAKCRHVFPVSRAEDLTEDSTFAWQEEPVAASEAEQESAAPFLEMEPLVEEEAIPAALEPGESEEAAFPFTSLEGDEPLQAEEEKQEPAAEMDFDSFDFGDEAHGADEDAAKAPAIDVREEAPATAAPKKEVTGLDFSDDDMFGEVVSQAAEEEPKESISFDMGIEGFADTMESGSGTATQIDAFGGQETAAENPFSLDEIDFGDELTSVAVQQVSTEELKPSQEVLFAPLAASEALSAPAVEFPAIQAPAAQEQAPEPVAPQRKEGQRLSGMLLLLWVMIAGLVAFYSIWGYKTLSELKAGAAKEAGRITLRAVDATYVKNKKLGTLLVISGEAVNEYSKPRAAIQVRGVIYGADGEEVVSKSAYCGNPLSEEELASMPLEKIEAAMANQFGDSLANMEVAPGEAVPFVVVIPKPAKGATDYGVEPAGSTPATDKPKEK